MRRGFTLLELIIVIIIIGILATLGLNQYMGIVEKSRGAEARQVVGQLRSLCAALYLETSNTSNCIGANMTYGDGTANTIPSTTCSGSHYFQYFSRPFAGGGGNPSGPNIRIVAQRCSANGKEPQLAGAAKYFNMSIDYTNGTVDTSSGNGGY